MLPKAYLPTRGSALIMAVALVITLLLAPSGASPVSAQSIPAACLNDAGQAVRPNPAAGIGAWLWVFNFNHAASATGTIGCIVTTTALNPQKVIYVTVTCQVINNQAQALVGGGAAAFDGKYAIQCPSVNQSPGFSQHNTNYTIWGRANFAQTNQTYAIVTHQDVTLSASVTGTAVTPTNPWYASLTSRYGGSTFTNSDNTVNVRNQTVRFESAVDRGTGAHKLNQTGLLPQAAVGPFPFHYIQPITIGGAGPVWTLYELVIDPPGGCCKGG